MGVPGLNVIVKKTPKELIRRYRRVVIDGSNLIFSKLESNAGQLRKQFPVVEWKSADKDILFQTKYIILNTVKGIVNFINDCFRRYQCDEVYFVMDPRSTSYVIDADMEFVNEIEEVETENVETINVPDDVVKEILSEGETDVAKEQPDVPANDDPMKDILSEGEQPESVDVANNDPVKDILNVPTDISTCTTAVPTPKPQTLRYNKFVLSILNPEEVENTLPVEINIKAEEQVKRKERQDKEKEIEKELERLSNLDIDPHFKDIISVIYKQSYHYNITREKLKLSRLILLHVEQAFVGRNVYIVDAVDEADLVIKNIVKNNIVDVLNSSVLSESDEDKPRVGVTVPKTTSSDYTLVISADTDYYILFSDSPTVHCRDIHEWTVYSPYKCWKGFLGDAYSYDAVIRAAAIFGNDYTNKENIIYADKSGDDLKILYNADEDHRFSTDGLHPRKKIVPIITAEMDAFNEKCNPDEPIPVTFIDQLIYNFDKTYFRKYYMSTIVYKNWQRYNGCTIRKTADIPYKIQKHTNYVLDRLRSKYAAIYSWSNIQTLFSDSNTFIDSISEDLYESTEAILAVYDKIDINRVDPGFDPSEYL